MLPLLIDLDGVLRLGNKLAPGAAQFLQFVQKERVHACILSNTTKLPAEGIRKFFESNRIKLDLAVVTALDSAIDYAQKFNSIEVYVHPDAVPFFASLPRSKNPEAVIIGDMGTDWSYDILNRVFRQIMEGAEIVAMQMNRFWQDGDGLALDAGSFITGLEYATSRSSTLVGKPSPVFFRRGLTLAGEQEKKKFIMLGDDLKADIYAAQQIGGQGVLILTGKTTQTQLELSAVKPDFVVRDLLEMIALLGRLDEI